MKKHSILFLSCSVLLSLNAFAPQMFWEESKMLGRFPSSLEEDRLEELALKEQTELYKEMAREEKRMAEKKKTQEREDAVSCIAKDKSSDLQAQVDALLVDNKSILEELLALKKDKLAKKDDEKEEIEIVVRKKKKKVFSSAENGNSSEVVNMMSQFTSMMMTQQQQQTAMMQQMITLMQTQQQQIQQYQQPQQQLPYAYPAYPQPQSLQSMLDYAGYNVGIGSKANNPSAYVAGQAPSEQNRIPAEAQPMIMQQPQQLQAPVPHQGFNFSNFSIMNDMQRMTF